MKRPKIIRPTKLTLMLPEDIRAKLDLHLFSQVENRVPMGAYQRFFIERIQEFFSSAQLTSEEKQICRTALENFVFEEAPQEWWVANFLNPADSYNKAKDLLGKL